VAEQWTRDPKFEGLNPGAGIKSQKMVWPFCCFICMAKLFSQFYSGPWIQSLKLRIPISLFYHSADYKTAELIGKLGPGFDLLDGSL
jgi:hypothetical protein